MENQSIQQEASTKEKVAAVFFAITVIAFLFLLLFPMQRDEEDLNTGFKWFLIFIDTPIMISSGFWYLSERSIRKFGTAKQVLKGKSLGMILIIVAIIAFIFYYNIRSLTSS